MGEVDDIRVGLLRRRVTHEEFAESCGMGLSDFKSMLESGEVSDGVRGAYAALDAGVRGCVFGRAVVNDRIQVINYVDGVEAGKVRKKREFRPREGLPCEVRESGEDGWLELVGKYRDNGVRLDK